MKKLLTVGQEGSQYSFLGVHKSKDDSTVISITSARSLIAFRAADASDGGGRYTPSADERLDVVVISCGDEDLGERWDCIRLTVTTTAGRRVTPLKVESGPRAYRNGFGTTWTARKVVASYRVADLRDGFVVTAAGADNVEFEEKVSKETAEEELLFVIPPTQAELDAQKAEIRAALAARMAAEPPPPDDFLVSITDAANGWTITADNAGYTWHECEAVINASRAKLPDLAVGVTKTVALSDFAPPIADKKTRPRVRCRAKGQLFEGPLPKEFAVLVRVIPAGYAISNLTDWGWSDCTATVGGGRAKLVYLAGGGTSILASSDFNPRPTGGDQSADALVFSCIANGKTVTAAHRSK